MCYNHPILSVSAHMGPSDAKENAMPRTKADRKPLTPRRKLTVALVSVLVVIFVVTMVVGNVVGFWWLEAYILGRRIGFDIANKKVETGHVVFVGDSITDSCDLDLYYEGLDAYNRGIAGDVTEGLLRRMDNSIFDLQPSLVVLLIGTNDFQRCHPPTVEHILGNYRVILTSIHDTLPDTKVLVQSVYPVADVKFHRHYVNGNGNIPTLNAGLKALADEFGYGYADVFPLLANEVGEMDMTYSKDGLHPNHEGYERISGYLRPIIDTMLAEPPKAD